jgi:hypothetical protein
MYPTHELQVVGTAIVDGFTMPTGAATGHVLTSDSNGNASWQAPASGDDGDWTVSGDDLYRNTGQVGVGTTIPTHTLDVHGDFQIISGGFTDIAAEVGSLTFTGSPANYLTDSHFVAMYSFADLASETDVLALFAGEDSDTSSQFIECSRFGGIEDREFRVDIDGDVYADGAFNAGGADFAEMVRAKDGAAGARPGDVMVVDLESDRGVAISSSPRSRLVSGVYSTRPGVIGSERDWDEGSLQEIKESFGEIPMAIVGIVPCRVSAENGPIRRGDLLVTSSVPGHAMKDDDPAVGTVLGKALGGLESGTGLIDVLITLQ